MRAGAPLGERHGKAYAPFEAIQLIREQKEAGMTVKQLACLYETPIDTIRDWVYYRTRILK